MPTLTISQMSTLTGSTNNNTCVFPILDLQTPNVSEKNEKLRVSAHNQFFSNNNSVGGLSSYNNYFGTGIDGDVTISSSAQISSSTSPAGLNNTLYGDVIVKNYKSLTINSGILFSPLRPCRGLIIYCTGDLTVNGTISMTSKGGGVGYKLASPLGLAPVTEARYDLIDATIYVNNMSSSAYRVGGRGIPLHWNWAPSSSAWFSNYKIRAAIISGSVAGGGPSVAATAGIFCGGGGGGGGGAINVNGGSGGRGSIFSGGCGGQGGSRNVLTGNSAFFEAIAAPAPGMGNAGYSNKPGGGLLVLIVRGNITVNGSVLSNGANGGDATNTPGTEQGAGGGAGGGRMIILYGGTYTNSGTVTVTGGAAGVGTSPTVAAAGGAGVVTIRKIHT